jgi:hypothetical protein
VCQRAVEVMGMGSGVCESEGGPLWAFGVAKVWEGVDWGVREMQ